ncbi:SDR family oxidoreductase [Metabacillus sp. JX24]|uniref:SDR family oxidoreductase n=1 Tax=Metabacillus sp. JX24 TaxID=3240759 RepID=UPI00350EF38A
MDEVKKVAIVTGGASGIGKAICRELIKSKVFVMIADVDEKEGKTAEAAFNDKEILSRYVHLNVSGYNSVEKLISETFKEFGRLDYLFNNAGIAMYGELYDMSIDHWKTIMDVNVWGAVNGTQAAYPLMKKQGFGHIVNTASAAGLGPAPVSAAYAATKHAVVGLTTSLHYEAEEYGVKVTALCPAFVDTPIFTNATAINMDKDKMRSQMKKQKMMTPEKIAKLAIDGVHRNKPVICPMPLRKTMDGFFLLVPAAHRALMRLVCRVSREARMK